MNHGTYSNYVNAKCRCEECKAAAKKYRAEKRISLMPEDAHGTVTGYNYWRCNCGKCKQAGKEYRASLKTGEVPPGKKHGVTGRRVYGCECDVCVVASKESARAAYLRSRKGRGVTQSREPGGVTKVYWDGQYVGHATVGAGGYTTFDSAGNLIDWNPVLRYEFADKIVNHAREMGELN